MRKSEALQPTWTLWNGSGLKCRGSLPAPFPKNFCKIQFCTFNSLFDWSTKSDKSYCMLLIFWNHKNGCWNFHAGSSRRHAGSLRQSHWSWLIQCEVSCSVPAPTTMKKIAKVWARLLSHLDICQNYYEKVRSTAANLGALEGFWTKMPCEVSCGIAAPTTMKNIDAVWRLFAMNLDIYQDYSEKVWYAAANLDALATLETTSSTKWTVAPKPKHDEVNCESKIPSRQAFQT